MQLTIVEARAELGSCRGNMNQRSTAQPTKLEGSTSWAVFRQRIETLAEHNYRTPREKATYPIGAFNELDVHILHGIPTGVTYEVVEGLENRYGDHLLETAFHSQLKRRAQLIGESVIDCQCHRPRGSPLSH